MKKLISLFCGKKFLQKFWTKIYQLSLKGMNIGTGGDFNTSGEINSLCYVKRKASSELVIFDVGANIGGYTKEVIDFFEGTKQSLKYTIHCFEPAHETFESLCKNIVNDRVIKNNFGLSNVVSTSVLYYDKENSGLASLYKRQIESSSKQLDKSEEVLLSTIDKYCEDHNIEYIDLLKMDIEGNELNALYGAKEILKNRKIGAIQIEFGGCNLDSRTFLRDFWNLLNENYKMYRILKDGLWEIKSYDEKMEIFTCGNYFFAKKGKK